MAEIYPNSDRGLAEMTEATYWARLSRAARLAILRGIQEAAFRSGREAALSAAPVGGPAPMPPVEVGDWIERSDLGIVAVANQWEADMWNDPHCFRQVLRDAVTQIRKANGAVWRRERAA